MAIVTPGGDQGFHERLIQAGVEAIPETEATTRDVRPARVGLLNLMPRSAMETTEVQWFQYMGEEVLQVEPVLVKFDDDWRERDGASRQQILRRYTPFSEVRERGLDGLIVTGDNLEIKQHIGFASRDPIPDDDIKYMRSLEQVLNWARENVQSTIYSCLAGHLALRYFHGLPRQVGGEKTLGVFEHDVVDPSSPFTRGMNDTIHSPHSRWGFISPEEIARVPDLGVLAINDEVGWLLVEEENEAGGRDLYVQGHPEYGRLDLHGEYMRDREEDGKIPKHYYKDEEPGEENVRQTWATDARALHANFVAMLYEKFSRGSSADQA
ncbi:MAG TPA: homoserine O-succinyltransferase [Candidatus Saccharimonadales bacterium]|nr:homoserine O-succinyltransferase [Candidatus Saccharimonadales bacterium]